MNDCVILVGGGGHAKVIMDCILTSGKRIAGILDDGIPAGTTVQGVPVLGGVSNYDQYREYEFVIAIGDNNIRSRVAEEMDVNWCTVIHPTAVVSPHAAVGIGTVVMPNAVVNAGASVGSHCIINTGAIVEHDCSIADFVHVSPRAVLGGTVSVGTRTHIGIGASVRHSTSIGTDCVIGVGAAVVRDIREPGKYAGIPARRME